MRAAMRHFKSGTIVTGEYHWDSEMRKQVQSLDFDSGRTDWDWGYIDTSGKYVSTDNPVK